jgi:AraC family ethanolamine operon transcriptional activator
MTPAPTPIDRSVCAPSHGMTPPWRLTVHTDDAQAQATAQPDWSQEYRQLSAGAYEGLVQHVQLPGVRLVREDSNRVLHQRGDLGRGAYGLAMPLRADGEAWFNGQQVGADAIMVGCGDELDLRTPQQLTLIAVVVDAALLQPLWQRMYQKPLSAWLASQLVVPARPAAALAVRQMHASLMDRLGDPSAAWPDDSALRRARDELLIEWIEALPERVDTSQLPNARARRQLVNRACELMLNQPDEPLSMLELCRQVGASRRKLSYCFQDVLGTSPMKYLRAVRLNCARRELRQGQGPVQDVAARWGFWHSGQFAVDYRRQFGESPSATLREGAFATNLKG